MWQSRVEIEGYSITYFNHITAFEAVYHWTSIKGGAHMCFVDLLDIHASTKYVWAPPWKFSDAPLQICDRIILESSGLPHSITKEDRKNLEIGEIAQQ